MDFSNVEKDLDMKYVEAAIRSSENRDEDGREDFVRLIMPTQVPQVRDNIVSCVESDAELLYSH